MNLELKSIKHSEFASEETFCYEAAIYLDKKPLALVSNDGKGGCDRGGKHPRCKLTPLEYHAKMQGIQAYFKTLPAKQETCGDYKFDHQPDLESWCGDQVAAHLQAKDLKKLLKAKITLHDTEKNQICTIKRKYEPAQLARIETANKGFTVLNALTFDEAFAIYSKANGS